MKILFPFLMLALFFTSGANAFSLEEGERLFGESTVPTKAQLSGKWIAMASCTVLAGNKSCADYPNGKFKRKNHPGFCSAVYTFTFDAGENFVATNQLINAETGQVYDTDYVNGVLAQTAREILLKGTKKYCQLELELRWNEKSQFLISKTSMTDTRKRCTTLPSADFLHYEEKARLSN
jgi:hypothetical protein